MSFFEKNLELFNYYTSTKCIEDILYPIYNNIDQDSINIVDYSLIFEVSQLIGSYNNIVLSNIFLEMAPIFSQINIIPIFKSRLNEYIGYDILTKRFYKITYNKPNREEFLTKNLLDKEVYLVGIKSSMINNYINLKFIDSDYKGLVDAVKNFITEDKLFKKFLQKTKPIENGKKRCLLSKIILKSKIVNLIIRISGFISIIRKNNNYTEESENFLLLKIYQWLDEI